MCELLGQIDEHKMEQLRNFRKKVLKRYTSLLSVKHKMSRFRYWSQEAYKCFMSGSDCDKCAIKTQYGIECHMKKSLDELLDAYGVPKNIKSLEAKWKNYEISP